MRKRAALVLLAVQLCSAWAAVAVRPATSSFPFFSGVFDILSAPPVENNPAAPATIKVAGLARRAANYPVAPELSIAPVERLSALSVEQLRAAAALTGEERQKALLGLSNGPRPLAASGAPASQSSDDIIGFLPSPAEGAAAPDPVDPPQPRHGRRLRQAPRVPVRRRASAARAGFFGTEPSGASAGGGGGGAAIAASADRAVHVTAGALAIYALSPAPAAGPSGGRNGTLSVTRLQDLFSPVGASNCADGIYDASAVFDPASRRFFVAAACGGTGSALVGVSATAEPHGQWYVYNVNADGVGTALACPNGESLLLDYPRINLNADAVAVSAHVYCPSSGAETSGGGGGAAVLMVLPKGALASGETRWAFPIFTSFEVARAAGAPEAAARALVQLEPAVPQYEDDVTKGHMYFVADLGTPEGQPRRSYLLVALVNTGAMWGFAGLHGPNGPGVTPFLAASVEERGSAAARPLGGGVLPQPDGAPELQTTGLPAGFWSGRAVYTAGKVWMVDEASAADNARTSTLAWGMAQPFLRVSGSPPSCVVPSDWGYGFDYSSDRSEAWGNSVQPAWESFVYKAMNVSRVQDRAANAWNTHRVPRRVAEGDNGMLALASAASEAGGTVSEATLGLASTLDVDPDFAAELARSDISPFTVPSKAIPRTPGRGASERLGAPEGDFRGSEVQSEAATAKNRWNSYGNTQGGFRGWRCWTCGYGTNGFYIRGSKYTNSWANYNWGFLGLGRIWGGYGGGGGSGGWGGGYFGGHSFMWGTSTMNRSNRYGGTGGMGAWGRRLLETVLLGGGGASSAPRADPTHGGPEDEEITAALGILEAQISEAKNARPVCTAPEATCVAARRAGCPEGAEPAVVLSAHLVRRGELSQQSAGGLAFAAPGLVVARDGTMLIAATYSGAGRIKGSAAPAYPGLATVTVAPDSSAAVLRIEQHGAEAASPAAVRSAGAWPAQPAMAVQADGGAAFMTVEKLPGSSGGSWVSVIDLMEDHRAR